MSSPSDVWHCHFMVLICFNPSLLLISNTYTRRKGKTQVGNINNKKKKTCCERSNIFLFPVKQYSKGMTHQKLFLAFWIPLQNSSNHIRNLVGKKTKEILKSCAWSFISRAFQAKCLYSVGGYVALSGIVC